MIILQRRLFSSKKKSEEEEKEDELSPEDLMLAGAGTYIGGRKITKHLHKKSGDYVSRTRNNSPNAETVRNRIIKEAKGRGIQFYDIPSGSSAYAGAPPARMARKKLDKYGSPVVKREVAKHPVAKHVGKDAILVNRNSKTMRDVDVIAHEVGHAYNSVKGRPSTVIGRTSHVIDPISKLTVGPSTKKGRNRSDAAMFLHGVVQGVKKENNKKDGKKDSKWTKYGSVALPLTLAAPALISEAAASRRAMKLLKKHGADKATKRLARKRLGAAWGTYGFKYARPVIAGGSGELVGRGIGKYINQDPTEKD